MWWLVCRHLVLASVSSRQAFAVGLVKANGVLMALAVSKHKTDLHVSSMSVQYETVAHDELSDPTLSHSPAAQDSSVRF